MSELLMSELPDYPITDHPCLYQWSLSMVGGLTGKLNKQPLAT